MPDKYLSVAGEKQTAIGLELGTVFRGNEKIPVAVSWEPSLIRFWWWNGQQWQRIERHHPPITSGDLYQPLRVACVPAKDRVYLVYKRDLNPSSLLKAIFIETFAATTTSGGTTFQSTGTIAMPLIDLDFYVTGGSLWAAHDPVRDELLILTNGFRWDHGRQHTNSQLVLFRGRDPFSSTADWHVISIDEGGFAADALRGDRELVIVHRKTQHSFSFPRSLMTEVHRTPGISKRLDLRGDDPEFPDLYAPLDVRIVNLDSGQIVDGWEMFSGGDHPQVQATNPVRITVDRLVEARLIVGTVFIPGLTSVEWRMHWDELHMAKQVVARTDNRATLFTYDGLRLPRALSYLPAQYWPTLVGTEQVERFPRRPIFVTHNAQDPRTKIEKLEIVAHVNDRVELRRYVVTQPNGLHVEEIGRTVLDINHEQIRSYLAVTQTQAENSQFEPTTQLVDNSQFYQTMPLDNTLGGLLVLDRATLPDLYLGYIDLGDDGPRVLTAPTFIPTLVVPPRKELLPEDVSGAPGTNEAWVELTSSADWLDARLRRTIIPANEASRPPVAIFSPLQIRLDAFIDFAITIPHGTPVTTPAGDRAIRFTAAEISDTQSVLQQSQPEHHRVTIVSQPPFPQLTLSVTPGIPAAKVGAFYNVSMQLNGTSIPAGAAPTASLSFQELVNDMPSGPVIPVGITLNGLSGTATAAVPRKGSWRCTASIELGPALARTLEIDWDAEEALADTLWDSVRGINDSTIPIGGQRVSWGTINNVTIKTGFMSWILSSDGMGDLGTVDFVTGTEVAAKYRFLSGGQKQGRVDYRVQLLLESATITLTRVLSAMLAVDKLTARVWVGRTFTPCILHRDKRSMSLSGDMSDAWETVQGVSTATNDPACGLAMKPVGPPYVDASDVSVSARLLPALDDPVVLIALLVIIGLASLVPVVQILAAVGAFGLVALLAIKFTARRTLEGMLAKAIGEAFTSPEQIRNLSEPLLRYAGEGLAESIARNAIKQAITDGIDVAPPEADPPGRVRLRDQFYQTVLVTEGKLRLLLRTRGASP